MSTTTAKLAGARWRGKAGSFRTLVRRPQVSDHGSRGGDGHGSVVIVIVIVPVLVAALVNGNDAVIVIDAVDDQGSITSVSIATTRSSTSPPRA
jgi:hypothetical protein